MTFDKGDTDQLVIRIHWVWQVSHSRKLNRNCFFPFAVEEFPAVIDIMLIEMFLIKWKTILQNYITAFCC